MHLMQYEIPIPDGYDIRKRVETRGTATDDYPGLGLKAYCITATHYAPFYVWRAPEGMNRFLFGNGGFQHIVADFGRPPVRHWMAVAFHRGPAPAARTAIRRTVSLPPEADPISSLGSALADFDDFSKRPGLHASALGIDPHGWQIVQFTLWEDEAPVDGGTTYEVLHISRPELEQLENGRQW
jgi:hypothetical protein